MTWSMAEASPGACPPTLSLVPLRNPTRQLVCSHHQLLCQGVRCSAQVGPRPHPVALLPRRLLVPTHPKPLLRHLLIIADCVFTYLNKATPDSGFSASTRQESTQPTTKPRLGLINNSTGSPRESSVDSMRCLRGLAQCGGFKRE